MHSHAWPLYSAIKLLGTEFHGDGVRFKPGLPLEEYECNTPLLGFKKTPKGYSGWYSPTQRGSWRIEVELPDVELTRLNHLSVNGMQQAQHHDQGRIAFRGNSAPGAPLRWQVSFR
jgi:hypothetical protein